MTPAELNAAVAAGTIDTVVVGFTDHYGRLLGKRFDAGFFLEAGLTDGTHACDYLLTVDMAMEPVEGFDFSDWEWRVRRLPSRPGHFHVAASRLD